MATKGTAHRRSRRQRRRRATAQRVAARPPAPRHPERRTLAKVLFHLAVWPVSIGVIVGVEIWTPAQVLLIAGGAVLLVLGVLTAAGTVPPLDEDKHTVGAALVAGLLGLAAVGFGLESVDEPRPWSVLMLPAIVVGGVWCLRVGIGSGRSPVLRRPAEGTWGPPWAARTGFIMFGLTWPWFALVALGLAEFD